MVSVRGHKGLISTRSVKKRSSGVERSSVSGGDEDVFTAN